MKQKQYFQYTSNNETKKYLLMPNEVENLEIRIEVLGIEKAFSHFTGKTEFSNVKLIIELYGPNDFLYTKREVK